MRPQGKRNENHIPSVPPADHPGSPNGGYPGLDAKRWAVRLMMEEDADADDILMIMIMMNLHDWKQTHTTKQKCVELSSLFTASGAKGGG